MDKAYFNTKAKIPKKKPHFSQVEEELLIKIVPISIRYRKIPAKNIFVFSYIYNICVKKITFEKLKYFDLKSYFANFFTRFTRE